MQQPKSNRINQKKLLKNMTPLNLKQEHQMCSPLLIAKDILSPNEPDSPSRKKKNLLLARAKVSDIEVAHNQLNNYIDLLDNRVTKLVQKHQAQFLVAYRNHIKKVREQMQEIRNKALSNANSTVSQTQKIQALEKQLTIFREQSLKLFQKVNEKQGTIYKLKIKISQLQSQKSFLQRSLRELTKRNKQLQGLNYQSEVKKSMLQIQTGEKQFFISRPPQQQIQKQYLNKTGTPFIRSRPYTTAINSKGESLRSRKDSIQISKTSKNIDKNYLQQQIWSAIDETIKLNTDPFVVQALKHKLKQILKDQAKQNLSKNIASRQLLRAPKKYTNSIMLDTSKIYAKRSQLQQYFYKSIQTVKKQITRRKGLKSMNFYSQFANLNLAQFKKVDFFRLLQLLLSNEHIIATIHQKIFQSTKEYL